MNLLRIIQGPYLRFQDKSSYQDLLKALALLTMIIDHIGLFFFPDKIILRVIGRISVVIWLFFVGYNYRKSKSILDSILFLAVIVLTTKFLLSSKILTLNILFTITISKIILHHYIKYIEKTFNIYEWFFIAIICCWMTPLTNAMFEYGTLAFLITIWGYNLSRNIGNKIIQSITLVAIYTLSQIEAFEFNIYYSFLCFLLISLIGFCLHNFKPIIFEFKAWFKYLVNISARYSLYLYSFHVILFMFISRFL
ncbi:MAG: TraX family protein [Pseudomonadota bacterium]